MRTIGCLLTFFLFMSLVTCSGRNAQTEQMAVDFTIMVSLPVVIKVTNDCKFWKDAAGYMTTNILPVIQSAKPAGEYMDVMIDGMDKAKPEAKAFYDTVRVLFDHLSPERLEKLIKNIVGIINEQCGGTRHKRSL